MIILLFLFIRICYSLSADSRSGHFNNLSFFLSVNSTVVDLLRRSYRSNNMSEIKDWAMEWKYVSRNHARSFLWFFCLRGAAIHQSRITFLSISVIARLRLRAKGGIKVYKEARFSIIIKRCEWNQWFKIDQFKEWKFKYNDLAVCTIIYLTIS
jgi:hypothetical protein